MEFSVDVPVDIGDVVVDGSFPEEGAHHVAVVEDDDDVRIVVSEFLRAKGYRVSSYSNGVSADRAFSNEMPELLILDRMLPGISGDELCRNVRDRSTIPIIMLTALEAVDDRIQGLENGADDYVSKPFALRELQLRIDAQLRRTETAGNHKLFTAGPFRVNPARRLVWNRNVKVALTGREYELFLHLVRNPGRVFSRGDLLAQVWGWNFGDPATVTVHVRRLREKIESDPRYPSHLVTVWGAGYRFHLDGGLA